MDSEQSTLAFGVLETKRTALELTTQFISNEALRLDSEHWHVPRFGAEAIIRLNAFGSTVDEAFNIARRWDDVTWKRRDLCTIRAWHGAIDGIVLVIDHITGDQPAKDGEVINLFPGQVDDGAGI